MTWATIHYVTESTMAVEFVFAKRQKDAIAAMPGAEWDKSTLRWLVPVARLGDVAKLFWPSVTFDYRVLRARDHALVRMFAGYMAMGVRFAVSNGKVVCDHAVLNEWFATNATVLHVNALAVALKTNPKGTESPVAHPRSYPTPIDAASNGGNGSKPSQALEPAKSIRRGVDLSLWLTGVQNAVKQAEKKEQMIRRVREKELS